MTISIVSLRSTGTLLLVLWLLVLVGILVRVIEDIAVSNIIRIFLPPLLLLILVDCFDSGREALASNSLMSDKIERSGVLMAHFRS